MSDGKITVPSLLQRKSLRPQDGTKITCLTAYDYPTARLMDEAGVDVVLVGDSVAMVMLGYESTLPVTMDETLHHTRAGAKERAGRWWWRTCRLALTTRNEAVKNAVRFVKEAGAEAVKVEGGERRLEVIARLTEAEIPVMGHVGLTPQSVNAMGGYRCKEKRPMPRSNWCAMRARWKPRAFSHRAGRNSARAGCADYPRAADSDDRNRRRSGVRRADPGGE